MGCRILTNKNDTQACFYCSTSEVAFGPIMENEEEALNFLKWLEDPENRKGYKPLIGKGDDPREYETRDLTNLYYEFRIWCGEQLDSQLVPGVDFPSVGGVS